MAAFITYLATLGDGKSFRNTEYLTVRDGQVTSVNVYFGPSYRDGRFVTQKPSSRADMPRQIRSRSANQLSARKSSGARKRRPPGKAGIFRSSNSFSRSRLPATVSA